MTRWATHKDFTKRNFRSRQAVYQNDGSKSFFWIASRETWEVYPKLGDVDHITVCPPCQGYSSANHNGGINDEYNRQRSNDVTRAAGLLGQKTILFENLTGIMRKGKRRHRQLARQIFYVLDIKYVHFFILASDRGDPQHRRRFIVFAARTYICRKNPTKIPDEARITAGQEPLPIFWMSNRTTLVSSD